ncbi:hypothetical protein K0B04_04045 [Patescibacteria group bacterium]|nr:hypothetical protein [Patescibacteria group bacterium]
MIFKNLENTVRVNKKERRKMNIDTIKNIFGLKTDGVITSEQDDFRGNVYELGLREAHKKLGIACSKPGVNGEAVITRNNGKDGNQNSTKRSISYHRCNITNSNKKLAVGDILDYTPEATILVRRLTQGNEAFKNHILNEIRLSNNEHRRQSLRLIHEYAYPRNKTGVYGNDMFIWTPSNFMIPTSIQPTSSLGGHIVKKCELGEVIKSVIYGNNNFQDFLRKNIELTNDNGKVINPIWYAYSKPLYRGDYYVLPAASTATAFWWGVLTKDNIATLLTLGDLLINLEVINKVIWATPILRVTVPIENINDEPNFLYYKRALAPLGKWDRVELGLVEKCFQAFIPGSEPIKNDLDWNQSLRDNDHDDAQEIFSAIADSISVVGDKDGRTVVGVIEDAKNSGQPLILEALANLDGTSKPGWLFIGQTKNGKSTIIAPLADSTTQNVILIPCSREEFKSDWVKDNGGTVILFNRPDANVVLIKEGVKDPDSATIQKRQEELHKEDELYVKEMIASIEKKWIDREKIVGMPITFDIGQAAGITRYFNFISAFIMEWGKMWLRRHSKTRERCLFVFDNFTDIPSHTKYRSSGPLGSIPKEVATHLATQIKSLVSTGTNMGSSCWVATASPGDLSIIGEDFINHFNVRFYVVSDTRGYHAYVFSGPYSEKEAEFSLKMDAGKINDEMEIPPSLLAVLNTRLPGALKERYERLEFHGRGSEAWTERVPQELFLQED